MYIHYVYLHLYTSTKVSLPKMAVNLNDYYAKYIFQPWFLHCGHKTPSLNVTVLLSVPLEGNYFMFWSGTAAPDSRWLED